MKPLDVGKKGDKDEKSSKDDVHKPAVNIGQQKRTEKIKEKMTVARDKRKVNESLK